jgi:thiol-disulfide isomerase/thioredoxin
LSLALQRWAGISERLRRYQTERYQTERYQTERYQTKMKIIWLLVLVVASCYATFAQKQSIPILQRSLEQAPQFALKDVDGRTVRLSDYQGKVVLINFWATWCPPCRAEMPDLVRLQREYAKQGLQIIGITYPPERKDRVQRFARSLKVNYPIILGTREIKARFTSEETLPLTVVIDRDGKVSDIISGILLREEFDEKIKPLLMQKMEGEMKDAKSDH